MTQTQDALIARIEYIMDPSASAAERLARRAHLTNHDLRTILAHLRSTSPAGEVGEPSELLKRLAAFVEAPDAKTFTIVKDGDQLLLNSWTVDLRAKQFERLAASDTEAMRLHIVFDGPPGPEAGRFVEVETPDGRSVNAGTWHERDNGYWELRIDASLAKGGAA